MNIEAVSSENLAKLVHHYSVSLSPEYDRPQPSAPEWNELTTAERERMITATRLALFELRYSTDPASYGEMPSIAHSAEGTEGKECGC